MLGKHREEQQLFADSDLELCCKIKHTQWNWNTKKDRNGLRDGKRGLKNNKGREIENATNVLTYKAIIIIHFY